MRIGTSNISSDFSKAKLNLIARTNELELLGKAASVKIAKSLSAYSFTDIFTITAGYMGLKNEIKGLSAAAVIFSGALVPMITQMKRLASVDLSSLTEFLRLVKSMGSKSSYLSASPLGNKVAGSFRSGKDYVPYDDFPALLHKGEAVLTAGENEVVRGMGGVTALSGMAREKTIVNNKVELPDCFMKTLASISESRQKVDVTVELDGYEMAKTVASATNELGRQYNAKMLR